VQRGNLIAVQHDGTYATVGTLAITPTLDIGTYNDDGSLSGGRVSMANNGTQLIIVTGVYAYIYNTVTLVFTNITSAMTYPADTVTFLTGRFIVNRPGTGQFFMSGLYNGLTWGALDYATAESNPDNLQAVMADAGMLVLFGTSSTEIWTPFSDVAFPFTRVNASPSDGGLAARWSLSRCNGQLTGLFRNRQGALAIASLQGYVLTPISTPDIDYLISKYPSPEDAVGFGYTQNGKSFYQITFKAAGATWLYNAAAQEWAQLKGWGLSRHAGDIGASFSTNFVVSDYATGTLYTLSADAITDNGSPIEREITGTHSFAQSRNYMTIRRLRVDLEGGVGDLSVIDPKISLTISRDGGHTWGSSMPVSMGKMGEFTRRAEWRRLGQARDWVFKLRITDAVKVVIMAAVIEGRELGA
jgi:hypothetical protein